MSRWRLVAAVSIFGLGIVVVFAVGSFLVANWAVSRTYVSQPVSNIKAFEGVPTSTVGVGPVGTTIIATTTEEVVPTLTRDVSLIFVGDVMLDRNVAARVKAAKDDEYPFRNIVDDPRFTSPDLRVMNLEGPVTDQRRSPEKSIDFMFDPRFLPVLKQVGFDVASQANNHGHDQGTIGANDSRARLKAAGFTVFGDEVRNDDVSMATTTVNGRRIAFVGFNSVSAPINDEIAAATMAKARAAADTVIAFMHWGVEYHDTPSTDQVARSHWLIDHGADIIIGAHPHWMEGMSVYHGKPIVYSLGNFVFDQDWSPETQQGLSVGVKITDASVEFQLYPVQILKSQPSFLEGAERDARLKRLASVSDPSLSDQILHGDVVVPIVRH